MADTDPTGRIHERLDDIMRELGDLKAAVRSQQAACEPCRQMVQGHDVAINGTNGTPGLKSRMASVEDGRTDTLSLKGVAVFLGSIIALITAIGTAIAVAMGRAMSGGGGP